MRLSLRLVLLLGSTFHLYGQNPDGLGQVPPGPASAEYDPTQGPFAGRPPFQFPDERQPDLDSDDSPAVPRDAPVSPTISVAELQHPITQKGRSLLLRAQTELHAGKTAEGLADLDKALKEPSAAPYAHSLLGSTYLELGQVPDAIPELEQAVQLLPISANYSNLGYARGLNGDTEEGEKDLRRALELDPSSPQTHYVIGLLLLDSKSRSHEACAQLQFAQAAVQSAHMALAVCYLRAGQDDAADRQVKAFAGAGEVVFWKHWVSLVAGQTRPSLAFGFRPQ